jgi:hypothetical protein
MDSNVASGPPRVDFTQLPQLRSKSKETSDNPYTAVIKSQVNKSLASRLEDKHYSKMTTREIVSARMTKHHTSTYGKDLWPHRRLPVTICQDGNLIPN